MAYTDELPILKQNVLDPHPTGDDLENIMVFFLTNIGNDPAFARASQPTTNATVMGNIAGFAGELYDGRTDGLDQVQLLTVQDYFFVHTSFKVDNQPGVVFYFLDVGIGLISMPAKDGTWKYRRFAASGPFNGARPPGHARYARNMPR